MPWSAAITLSGSTGPTGLTGLHGVTGATGLDGVTGATGLVGPSGATGLDGVTGATGLVGPSGATGLDGVTGATGGQGATGATGVAGNDGVTGPTGLSGGQGATGLEGVTGATGLVGPSGATGLEGVTGATGPAGAGETGPTGYQGVTGPFGPVLMQFQPSAGTPTILSATSFTLNAANSETYISDCVTTPFINYQANGLYLSSALCAMQGDNLLQIGISGEGLGWTCFAQLANNGSNNFLGLYDLNGTIVGSDINYTPGDTFTMYADGDILTLTVYSTYAGQGTTVRTIPFTTTIATHMRFFALNAFQNTYTITNAFYMPTGLKGATGLTGATGSVMQGSMPSVGYYYAATTSAMTDGAYTVQPDTQDTTKTNGNFSATYTSGTGVLRNSTGRTLQILVSYDIKVSAATTWTSCTIVDADTPATILDTFVPNAGSLTVERSVVIPLLAGQGFYLVITQTEGNNANTLLAPYTRILFTQLDQLAGIDGSTGPTGPPGVQGPMPTLAYTLSAPATYTDDTATDVVFDTADATKTQGTFSATYDPVTGILNNPTSRILAILVNYDLQVSASTTWTSSNIIDSDTVAILDSYVPAAGSLRVERSVVILLQPSQNVVLRINQIGGSGTYDLEATYSRILFTQLDFLLGSVGASGATGIQGATGLRGATGAVGPSYPALLPFSTAAGTPAFTSSTSFILKPTDSVQTSFINYPANGLYLSIVIPLIAAGETVTLGFNGQTVGNAVYFTLVPDNIQLYKQNDTVGSSIPCVAGDVVTMIADSNILTLTVYSTYPNQGTTVVTTSFTRALDSYFKFFAVNPETNAATYTFNSVYYIPTYIGSTGPTGIQGTQGNQGTQGVQGSQGTSAWVPILSFIIQDPTDTSHYYKFNFSEPEDYNSFSKGWMVSSQAYSGVYIGAKFEAYDNNVLKQETVLGLSTTSTVSNGVTEHAIVPYSFFYKSGNTIDIVESGTVRHTANYSSGMPTSIAYDGYSVVYTVNGVDVWATAVTPGTLLYIKAFMKVSGNVSLNNGLANVFVAPLRGTVGATGPTGPSGGPIGASGATGPVGIGIPVGGTTGQLISKVDSTNYNIQWTTDVVFSAASSSNWATSDPTTLGSAINRIAALLSTINVGPIP